jgi:HlyD family secretion protein
MNLPSRRNVSLAAIGLVFLAGFAWVVVTQGPLAPIKVTVAKASETTLQRSLFGIGTLEARRSYAIGPTVAGRVAAVHVDQGDAVSVGQLLAEMDPVDLESRQLASGATAARALQLVAAAQATLAEATSRAHLAQTSAQRYTDLRRKNFVSQEAADAKGHEAVAARAAQNAATAALAAARDEGQRAQAEQAGLGKSRAHLRLLSPVAGVISARLAEPGSTVVGGQAVVQVIDPVSRWLRVRIDQGRSTGLAVGMSADIVLRSRPDAVLKGQVERVDLIGDAVAEERIANVGFATPPGNLAVGELAEVRLHLPPVEKALAVPATAIKRIGQVDGVWHRQEGRAVFVPIKPGVTSTDGMTQILDGISVDSEVIVHSQRAISAETRIKVVDALVKVAP